MTTDFENDILSLMQDILEFHDNNEYLPPEMVEELAFFLDTYLTDSELENCDGVATN